jgi:hypothetical protein
MRKLADKIFDKIMILRLELWLQQVTLGVLRAHFVLDELPEANFPVGFMAALVVGLRSTTRQDQECLYLEYHQMRSDPTAR